MTYTLVSILGTTQGLKRGGFLRRLDRLCGSKSCLIYVVECTTRLTIGAQVEAGVTDRSDEVREKLCASKNCYLHVLRGSYLLAIIELRTSRTCLDIFHQCDHARKKDSEKEKALFRERGEEKETNVLAKPINERWDFTTNFHGYVDVKIYVWMASIFLRAPDRKPSR